jgi:hypothetical protein
MVVVRLKIKLMIGGLAIAYRRLWTGSMQSPTTTVNGKAGFLAVDDDYK